ncbi:hypothetical protein, partial [Escherichia coli]|uniref:hypothetical protein n=1 Tax=Escherichia coli TaxID=562 RepID=UPI0022AF7141
DTIEPPTAFLVLMCEKLTISHGRTWVVDPSTDIGKVLDLVYFYLAGFETAACFQNVIWRLAP